jgi:signal transduction histidine kinase
MKMSLMQPACGFTIVCRVKPGRGDAIRAFATKLETSLRRHDILSPAELRHLRWTLFDGDQRAIYVAASETDFDQYVDAAIVLSMSTGIDTVFEHLEGFPSDWWRNRSAIAKFAREHQCLSLADCAGYRYPREGEGIETMIGPNRAKANLREDRSPQWLLIRESERKRIAQGLHDTTVQKLVSAKLYIENVQKIGGDSKRRDRELSEAVHLLQRSLNELRTLSYVMHPPMLDELGLADALRWYLRGFEERTGIKAIFTPTVALPRLSPAATTALFRIVQEAATNVYRHSESKVLIVSLRKARNSIVVSVVDRGSGIPPASIQRKCGLTGLGIRGMRLRAEQFQGKLDIRSSSRGTTLRATLPLTSVRAQP